MFHDRWGFDEWAKSYDEDIVKAANAGDWIFRDYERVLDKVVEYCDLPNNEYSQVLDIGTGTGNLAARFLPFGMHVIGLDPSEETRQVCMEKHPEIIVEEGDFLKIPLYLPPVDIIVSAYAFHHLNPREKSEAVLEMKRILNPGGRIVIADLMFRNAVEEQRIKQALRQSGRNNLLEELEDEYPGHFEDLTRIFNGEGFTFQGERLTESIWIAGAYLG
jgi:putative AdoMet-dependent methyltransferase